MATSDFHTRIVEIVALSPYVMSCEIWIDMQFYFKDKGCVESNITNNLFTYKDGKA